MKKVNKRLKIIIFCISILLVLFIFVYARSNNLNYLENILIFNLYENSIVQNYKFDLSSGISQKRNANLNSTIKIEGLANNKIAPGTKGEFCITLISSKNIEYKIGFESKNTKPKNLTFKIKDNTQRYSDLESLAKYLNGTVYKNCTERIFIEWLWDYEINNSEDIQDTLDGTIINKYNFDINVMSNEI